jgi:phenylpropionate dioxygenase-like ring-hydroxylating dioxygenase large terminal subunit
MFVNTTSLPHLLTPADYFSVEQHDRERQAIFGTAWHLVGTTDELSRDGDFLTVDVLGQSVQIRNFAGQCVAFSNVCAHRHCLLTHEHRGNSSQPRCQYHGWEYRADGRTARIPQAKNFAGINRDTLRLPIYRVETCGQLLFVSLEPEGQGLPEFLGPLYETCKQRFGPPWSLFLRADTDYPVNWKIPVENSLEAYHVPYIHPQTFGEDPGDARSQHVLNERNTSFGTQLPFDAHSRIDNWFQRGEAWFLRRLGLQPTGEYWQHHVFPNLLLSFTDAVSLCHAVVPTGPASSRAIVRQFGLNGTGCPAGAQILAAGWGRIAAQITRRILLEDQALYPDIQAGLKCSSHAGILGRCEERIHRFQQVIKQQTHADATMEDVRLRLPVPTHSA